ncbi:hypothetical protein GCM10011583_70420 [Streptomyces camponoticapitis]|uniref:Uncharacterized protein n=1 Tax=Streptomyces camponoticapitis TaxID=1616125 RepID=A0ABQ2EWI2_9ACTN|nr:hypothetical protein [Streptomyces camponoticapitis]GGK28350.1 hypothetical protein GCM10011583_70420 [Streptomyces camponoticapitis]
MQYEASRSSVHKVGVGAPACGNKQFVSLQHFRTFRTLKVEQQDAAFAGGPQ